VRGIQNFIPFATAPRAARIWLPWMPTRPVPAILNTAYHQRDGTARDAGTIPSSRRPWLCSVRVGIRGTGESDGVLLTNI
jgi:hypothetical protein